MVLVVAVVAAMQPPSLRWPQARQQKAPPAAVQAGPLAVAVLIRDFEDAIAEFGNDFEFPLAIVRKADVELVPEFARFVAPESVGFNSQVEQFERTKGRGR